LGTSRLPDPPGSYVVAAAGVIQAKHLPAIPKWGARVLNYLGDLSYPLYLVHVPLMFWVNRFTRWNNPYVYLGLALALSMVLYHGVDAPLRGRFSVRRREVAPALAVEAAQA
jgi:peptidoglycan/LPS O-acetylase OafA/YrhL